MDNDRLSLAESDEGYTAGFAIGRSGRAAVDAPLSLHRPLREMTGWLSWTPTRADERLFHFHKTSYGMAAFTPEGIESEAPIPDDRPYACLAYTASTQQTVAPARRTAYLNSLALGLLGTGLCEGVQNLVHNLANGIKSRGWSHQISDGGEPTALWRYSRQRLIGYEGRSLRHEVSWSVDTQLGWVTDVGAGLSWRWGVIRSPWWSFTPQQVEHAPLATAPLSRYRRRVTTSPYEEHYVWAGAMVRYRLYNSLLQGQFRDTTVEIANADMHRVLAEAWVGFTQRVGEGVEINLSIRARTREFDTPNSKPVLWGSLALHKYY